MNLRSTLRKAAGLLVELPPETEPETPETALPHSPGGLSSSTDDLWDQLEKASKPVGGAAPPPSPGTPAPTRTVEQIVQEEHGPNLDQIQLNAAQVPDPGPGGTLDFAAIYTAANLPTPAYSAEQILELLNSMPNDLPLAVRRQMVKAAMNSMGKAIGASPETIVADASRKLAALTAYAEQTTQLTTEYTGIAEKKIAALQAQIEETQRSIAAAQQKQAAAQQQCTAESHRLDEVLEFFSLDVPPSRYAGSDETKA